MKRTIHKVMIALIILILASATYSLLNPTSITLHVPMVIGLHPDSMEETQAIHDLATTIRNADAGTIINLRINSYGGSVFSGMEVINAIHATKAHVVAILDGAVMSEGSMIALACHEVQIEHDSLILIHMVSGGEPGDPVTSWLNDNILLTAISGILTDKELVQVFSGTPVIMPGKEFKERFDKLHAVNQSSEDMSLIEKVSRQILHLP